MTIRQVLYFSQETHPMRDKGLRALFEQSRAGNRRHEVTGLLLYVGGCFAQVLEGPPEPIGQLLANIRRDQRNCNVNVINDRELPGRQFPTWSMASLSRDLAGEEGFHYIDCGADLERIERSSDGTFRIMRSFFVGNAGLYFDRGAPFPALP